MKNQGNIVKFKNKNKSGILIAVLIFLAVLLLFLAVRYFIYDNFFKNKKLIINEKALGSSASGRADQKSVVG